MMKKILALTAALAMLTAVATGCGSDEESSKEASRCCHGGSGGEQ
ncbi:MAG: hypothetical protein ACLT2C_03320 [Ruminococcus sp.]